MLHRKTGTMLDRLGSLRLCLGAVIILIAALIAWEASAGSEQTKSPSTFIPITTPHGVTIQAELADTTQKRATGLMFRQSLSPNHGMLFAFAEEQEWSFWMKNTRITLDIIWMNKSKRIVHVERHVPICTRSDDGCPNYQPNAPAMYVLELASGTADALKLQRGVRLQFEIPPTSQ